MSKFVVDVDGIDVTELRENIKTIIETNPDGLSTEQFLNSTAGKIFVDILSGVSGFNSYHVVMARREAFLKHAKNRSSVIAGAESKGYSVFRGKNARLTVTFIPDADSSISKYDVVGSVNDTNLISLESKNILAGEETTLLCVVGTVDTETVLSGDDKPNFFKFNKVMTEDFTLYLDGVEVVTSKRLIDSLNEMFVVITNPHESVDVLYLNLPEFTTRYDTGDELSITFIVPYEQTFTLSQVTVDIGEQIDVENTESRSDKESEANIKVNAPLYQETQFVVKAREDYHKSLRLLDSGIVSTDYKNISPMVIALYYVKGNLSLLTEDEKESLLSKMLLYRVAGLEPPTFDEPNRRFTKLDVNIIVDETNSALTAGVDAALNNYKLLLGANLSFSQIEKSIELLSGVRIARLNLASETWQGITEYYLGNHVSFGNANIIQRMERVLYLSGSSEPTWPTTLEATVTDGKIIWKAKYLERQCDPINPILPIVPPRSTWDNETEYKVGDIVIPTTLDIFEYECVGHVNKSDNEEPVWPTTVGEMVIDGDIIWQAQSIVGTPDTWSSEELLFKGDSRIATDPVNSGTEDIMFQVIGFIGRSAGSTPAFSTTPNATTIDGNIVWKAVDKALSPAKLPNNEFFILTRSISITVAEDE